MDADEEFRPSSSDAIIASLINDVRKTNEPFDVKNLIGGNFKIISKKEGGSDRSCSHSRKRSKKSKRHKEKRSKKSKKLKHKSRSNSKSPARKKKKHRNRSHSSASVEKKSNHGSSEKIVNYAIPPSVEAVMEKISDDEDDLPIGADFLSMNASSSKIDEKSEELLQDISTAVQKNRELIIKEEVFPLPKRRNEEVFPLSKRRKKSESPPILRKPRPLSEILAKVRAERDNALVPRNIKLKQESMKSAGDSVVAVANHSIPKNDGTRCEESAVEYGPRPLEPLNPQPISDDDDELQLLPLKMQHVETQKSIKIAAISKIQGNSNQKFQLSEGGEIHVSDISAASSSTAGEGGKSDTYRSDDDMISDKHSRSEQEMDDNNAELKQKGDEKREKKEKKDKRKNRRNRKQSSSSSDSENEWKRLERKKRERYNSKEFLKQPRREFDKTRKRSGNIYVQSYYVDSNKKMHEGSKWHWNRNEKDLSDKIKRSKGWKLARGAKFLSPERKRRRSSSSSFSRSRTRSQSRSSLASSHSSYHHKSRNSYHYRRHHHHRDRESKSRRRSSDESVDHKIDKKKLLEIAQRNAAQMAQFGYLPNATPEVRAQLKAGGQSVDQLVDFCQRLQRSQDKAERREKGEKVSSDEEDLAPRKKKGGEDDTDFVKHPFALKPAAPITINIPNSINISVKTPAQRTLEESQLRITYPVSSGVQHREKDTERTHIINEVPSMTNEAQKTKFAASSAQSEKEKITNPLTFEITESFILPPPPTPPVLASFTQPASSLLNLPPPPPPPDLAGDSSSVSSNQHQSSLGLDYGSIVTVSEDESVFREQESLHHTPENVGRVMAKRIRANNLLAKDPNDYEARRLLNEADNQIKAWAESQKNLPGKFTGSTGVNILRADQLGPKDPRFSAWVKKDLFKQANAVNSGVGLKLMQKMGWTPGEGLGKGRDGPLEPLVVDIKSDRKGLVSTEELTGAKKPRLNFGKAGKHPVSILMELCSKKHWPVPQFSCSESGPSNNRKFLWKAIVNGVEYQPAFPSASKKTGKAQTCQVVLESLGLVPSEPAIQTQL